VEKYMARLNSKSLIFITGVEGSGTTMLLRMLNELPGYASLGGNFFDPGQEAIAARLNDLTGRLWRIPYLAGQRRNLLLDEIRNCELPDHVSHVVYKRSFPFLDARHYPCLRDVFLIAESARIIIIKRAIDANARSILRRGFESDLAAATRRSREAVRRLHEQAIALPGDRVLDLTYEHLIDAARKAAEVSRLAAFLGLPAPELLALARMITGPTGDGPEKIVG
jgi:hypothetical protein